MGINTTPSRPSWWRWATIGIASVCLIGIGVALGSRLSSHEATGTVTVAASAPSPATTAPAVGLPHRSRFGRSAAGAAAAAAAAVSALDGAALLDRQRVRALVASLASSGSRARLAAAYDRAATDARARLGVDSVPPPVVFVRAFPIGYRIDRFTTSNATVSVWRVGVVGSGATVPPQQSWRTETVSLAWQSGRWKVDGFASEPGPTPPLGTTPSTAADLFASVPRFKEFTSANP